jgi:hypothetical protein
MVEYASALKCFGGSGGGSSVGADGVWGTADGADAGAAPGGRGSGRRVGRPAMPFEPVDWAVRLVFVEEAEAAEMVENARDGASSYP